MNLDLGLLKIFCGSCQQPYKEGFVHHGMFEAAEWTAEHVAPVLKEQLQANKG